MNSKNEKGFTLIEVIASLAIISLILILFSQFFIQNYQTANQNTEKLVAINLADGFLERLKVERPNPATIEHSFDQQLQLNDKTYLFSVSQSQNAREMNMKIINVVVTVQIENSETKGVVEGYVSYD